MSFGYLSYQAWIAMCLVISIYMIYMAVKRRKIDRKGLIVTYFTLAISALLSALYKLIDKVFIQLKSYNSYIFKLMMGLLLLIFFELTYLAVTTKKNERSKKMFRIAIILIACSVVPLAIWILVDLYLQHRL